MDSATLFVAFTAIGAASLTLAAVHGLIWLLDRQRLASLAFCAVALSVAAMASIEFALARATSADQYGQLVRWFHVPLFFFTAGLVLFVRLNFGTGRAALGWTVIGLRGAVTAGNTLGPSTASWNIVGIEQVPLLGELASASSRVEIRPLQWLATAAALLLAFYVLDAAIALWRKPERDARRRAVVIGGAIVAFVLIATVQTQLVIWGLLHMPIILSPVFLIILAAITYELCRDIVASARIDREAQEQRILLTHLSRVATLGELSGGIAHELNQPLTAILSNAQAARQFIANKTGDPEMLAEILQDIIVADQRAGEVIRRLHAMFKRGERQLEKLDVNVVVQDVLGIVHGDLVTRAVTAVAQLGEGLPPVHGDRIELQQVVLNLVMNACEAMSATASEERQVTISTATVAGGVQVTVSDRGSGFTSEQHARMFEPFYTTKPRGLGLGLSISRAIILAHGGRVWCTARAGGGAAFHVALPPIATGGLGPH